MGNIGILKYSDEAECNHKAKTELYILLQEIMPFFHHIIFHFYLAKLDDCDFTANLSQVLTANLNELDFYLSNFGKP